MLSPLLTCVFSSFVSFSPNLAFQLWLPVLSPLSSFSSPQNTFLDLQTELLLLFYSHMWNLSLSEPFLHKSSLLVVKKSEF